MANTTNRKDNSLEKALSTSPQNAPLADSKLEEVQDLTLDQNEIPVLDDTGIKSTPVASEHESPHFRGPSGDNADLPPEPPVEQPGGPEKEYSILTVTQKRMILVVASFASLFSPMATAIYCRCSIPSS
jgi:hypothetical protein